MKLLRHILWGAACGLLFIQCSKDDSGSAEADTNNGNYSSVWYYSYDAEYRLTGDSIGLTAAEFIPYTIALRGDTLLAANIANNNLSLVLFDLKTKQPMRTISSWRKADGTEQKFGSYIEAIVVTDKYLYVEERQSYIHVFDLPDLNYVVSIGNGKYSGPVFQAQALEVKDGLIYARDKNGRVSVYKESDVTPANAGKINRYKQAGGGSGNNGFAPHYMEFDAEGRLMLTDYEGKAIRVLDISQINDDFKNGTVIDIAELAWTLPFKPRTFASTEERMYATGDNNSINIYDRASQEWISALKKIKGFTFIQPYKIYRQDDETFWISDIKNPALVKMTVYKGEIREFSRISDRIIRVDAAVTTKGAEPEPFYVDVRTHEIVDPATIGE